MKMLLVCKDTHQYTHWFPLAMAYIARALIDEGIEVEIYDQEIHHYSDRHLTEHLNNNHFDFIGVTAIGGYYEYKRLIEVSASINKSKNRPFYLLGGYCSAPEPEYFLKKTGADAIVIGEGDVTIVELIKA